MKLELISFKLCPYVQRSVVTLGYKKAPYNITYIDLKNPPAWFLKISPLGKVPVLKVNDETVLFESAVINEFIDEVIGTPLLTRDPLQKAFERAWIEYSSELFSSFYQLVRAKDQKLFDETKTEFFSDLQKLEEVLPAATPFFRGENFSLADSSYAPLFTRLSLSKTLMGDGAWSKIPRVQTWLKAVLDLPAVKNSVVPEFETLFFESMKNLGGFVF